MIIFLAVFVFGDNIKEFINIQTKKHSLREFYTQLSSAYDQKQWSDYYDFYPQSIKRFVPEYDFEFYFTNEKEHTYSTRTIIQNIEINENIGKVTGKQIDCLSSDCTGSNQNMTEGSRTFIYENNKWKIPEEEPSVEALSKSKYLITNELEENRIERIKNFSYFGYINLEYAIHNYAIYLDNNPEQMAAVDNWIETYKASLVRQNTRVVYLRPSVPMPATPTIKPLERVTCRNIGNGSITCTNY